MELFPVHGFDGQEGRRRKEGRKDGMVPCYTQQVKYPNISNFVPEAGALMRTDN